jgi:hypothetical protein
MNGKWTVADLAELVEMACSLGVLVYCESCQVIPVEVGDKYCIKCAGEIADYLAMRFDEQRRVDGGLY